MTSGDNFVPRGFRTTPPRLLSPAQLLEAARTLTRYADAAKARGEPILEAKFRQRAHEMRTRATAGEAWMTAPGCIYKFRPGRDASGAYVGELVDD